MSSIGGNLENGRYHKWLYFQNEILYMQYKEMEIQYICFKENHRSIHTSMKILAVFKDFSLSDCMTTKFESFDETKENFKNMPPLNIVINDRLEILKKIYAIKMDYERLKVQYGIK